MGWMQPRPAGVPTSCWRCWSWSRLRIALVRLQSQPFVREVGTDEQLIRLFVDRGETAMPAILRILDGAGVELKTISLTRPSLDDVFLRQTGRSLREAAA